MVNTYCPIIYNHFSNRLSCGALNVTVSRPLTHPASPRGNQASGEVGALPRGPGPAVALLERHGSLLPCEHGLGEHLARHEELTGCEV